ncbi:hypothetical protein HN51_070778 [Arachis hypogaea]|uniref:HMA domain-containing protein n=1 Tax=Arachis hypogaea TaxID=3818 RepID=A0A444Z0R8_ARAHY|nr:uncharacterized protein PF07_0086 isoform X1 [Arachis ipaensis]XP_025655840.1 uncharacterized protein PF07_0086 [Arachis hypogaea]QHO13379.1 putative protein-like isoform [Arachis hypogaea]RYR07765.1 hypothetical protein Ahy_B05g075197 [Arachis hypogaea]
MKQKLVIKVEMHCEKCRNKALTIAADVKGVTSVALEGDDKDQVVVTGSNINTICLLNQLNKKFKRSVSILTIEDLKKKEEEDKKKKEEEKKKKEEEEKKKKEELEKAYALLCHALNCSGKCDHCSKCEMTKCQCKCVIIACSKCKGKCEKCDKCEGPKCKCKCELACSKCEIPKCDGKCSKPLPQPYYINCPPWYNNPPPYYYNRVVYESNPDNCSIM